MVMTTTNSNIPSRQPINDIEISLNDIPVINRVLWAEDLAECEDWHKVGSWIKKKKLTRERLISRASPYASRKTLCQNLLEELARRDVKVTDFIKALEKSGFIALANKVREEVLGIVKDTLILPGLSSGDACCFILTISKEQRHESFIANLISRGYITLAKLKIGLSSVVLVPLQAVYFGKLLQKMLGRYDGSFVRLKGMKHVIVTGHITYGNLVAFANEFYSKRNRNLYKMVVLLKDYPTRELELLARTKFYQRSHQQPTTTPNSDTEDESDLDSGSESISDRDEPVQHLSPIADLLLIPPVNGLLDLTQFLLTEFCGFTHIGNDANGMAIFSNDIQEIIVGAYDDPCAVSSALQLGPLETILFIYYPIDDGDSKQNEDRLANLVQRQIDKLPKLQYKRIAINDCKGIHSFLKSWFN